MATRAKKQPSAEQQEKMLPDAGMESKKIPEATAKPKELPKTGSPENTVIIGEQLIEIKPTKLKYQRNRTAAFYRVLEMYPLVDILAMEAGSFGDERDGDKATMDWRIAATDDEQLVLDNYDSMDTGTIEKILSIFKRVNKIEEKEAKIKNMERERKEGKA
jgi:hypothetical protein